MPTASVTSSLQNNILQLLGVSNTGLARSTAALAAGNRLTQASTDIAALSAATGLQTQVTSLRAASQNIGQASSFLQVAEGGLQQQSQILDRLNALAVQANSGALNDSARRGLNTEFQNLVQELDRISGNTNFNGVNLLDGSLSTNSAVTTSAAQGEQASGSLTFAANINAGETIELNGVTLTEGVDFNAAGTADQTVSNLAQALNSDSRFAGFSFEAQGGTLAISADAAGSAGNQFTIDQGSSTATFSVSGDALGGNGVFSLSGGTDEGLSAGDTQASGTVNGSLLTQGTGSAASTQFNFNSAADIQAGDTIQIDDGEGGFTTFTYVNGTPANANEIQIGSSLEETLQNTAQTLNDFSGAGDFGVRQLTATVDGNSLVLTGNQNGDVNDVSGNAIDVALGTTGGSATNTQLDNGTTGGVNVDNVTASGFTGTIEGFEANFTGADQATVSVNVGGETFTANISDTTPGTDTTVTFTSENGGSFEVTLAAGQGVSVNSQSDTDALAAQFDTAFSGLNFTQSREITSFNGTGQLNGASLELNSDNFSNLDVESINVSSGLGGTGSIEIRINGETFRTEANLGQSIGAGERVTLTSTSDPSRTLEFTNGNTELDFSTNADARALEDDFEEALGVPGNQGAAFQIGANAEEAVRLSIGNTSADSLFNGQDINILSAENASQALNAVQSAIDRVTGVRADVGSFQSALDYAAAQVDTAIQNQEAARASLADTDIAAESTQNAQLTVLRQAQLASLAQTNRLQSNLLSLIQ